MEVPYRDRAPAPRWLLAVAAVSAALTAISIVTIDQPLARWIALWSGWQTDGILYLAARDASGGFVAGAHLTATSIGFFVHPAWRGHGWGSRLVGACADQAAAHGLHALHAATRPDNLPAQALLSRTGFSRVGTAGLARWDYRRDL